MATTISNYKNVNNQVGTLTNPEGALRPDKGHAYSNLLITHLDILPQLDLPGNAIAPLTGVEVLLDEVRSTIATTFIQVAILSGSVSYIDRVNHTNGNATVGGSATDIIFGSSSIAGNVWSKSTNAAQYFSTGSTDIQRISSASTAADKLKVQIFINTGGANQVLFKNVRTRLTYTPAVSPSTQFRRPVSIETNTAPGGGTGFLGADNLLDEGSGDAESNITGSVIEMVFPDTATVLGYEIHASASNDGSGSVPDYGTLGITARLVSGSAVGTLNTFEFRPVEENTDKSIGFGGTEDLQGLSLTPADINGGLKLRVEYSSSTGTNETGSFSILGGSGANISPSLRVYFANTNSSSYTRTELRNRTTASENFAANDSVTFELVNNLNSTAYFNIEGTNNKDIFNTASITNLVSCSVITESMHAGFIVNRNSTASFLFTPTEEINSESISFIAANPQVFGLDDNTSSGSVFGVDLELT